MFNQHYYWVPMNHVRSIKTEAPSDLRDLVWLPAEVTWTNGGQVMVMMPVRYPGLDATEGLGRLGKRTDWKTESEGLEIGLGQRMLATDQKDYPLLEVRDIQFEEG